jgi:hypothetical protein
MPRSFNIILSDLVVEEMSDECFRAWTGFNFKIFLEGVASAPQFQQDLPVCFSHFLDLTETRIYLQALRRSRKGHWKLPL